MDPTHSSAWSRRELNFSIWWMRIQVVTSMESQPLTTTAQTCDAQSGQAIGLAQYTVSGGHALQKALELAEATSRNAPLTNFAVLQALPRISGSSNPASGYLLEALMSAVSQGEREAQHHLAFLAHRAKKITRP